MFVYMGNYKSKELNEEDWKNWRSFFFSGAGEVKLKFVESKYT